MEPLNVKETLTVQSRIQNIFWVNQCSEWGVLLVQKFKIKIGEHWKKPKPELLQIQSSSFGRFVAHRLCILGQFQVHKKCGLHSCPALCSVILHKHFSAATTFATNSCPTLTQNYYPKATDHSSVLFYSYTLYEFGQYINLGIHSTS